MATSGVPASARAWTREEIFGLVLQQRGGGAAGSLLLQGLTLQGMDAVWLVLCEAIAGHLAAGKALNVPGFGRFGLNRLNGDAPSLVLADGFARAYHVSVMPAPTVLAGILDNVNVTGLSLEAALPKDQVRAVVTEVFACVGSCVAANARPVAVEFPGVGTLRCEARRVRFDFDFDFDAGSEGEPSSASTARSARRGRGRGRRLRRGLGRGRGREDADGEAASVTSIPSARSVCVSLGLRGAVPRLDLGRTSASGCGHSVGSSASALSYLSGLSAASSALGSIAETQNVGSADADADADAEYDDNVTSRSRSQPGRTHRSSSQPESSRSSGSGSRSRRSSRSRGRGEPGPRGPDPLYFRDKHSTLPCEEHRLEWRLRQLDANLDTEFARLRADIDAQVDSLRHQDVDIARRNQMSEMAYKSKLLEMKKEQLKLNAFLIEQAKERREHEARERAAFRGIGADSHLPEGRPYPVEVDPDPVAVARVKRNLDEALKDQIGHKARLQRQTRAHKVAEERFLGDRNAKVIRKDRELRHRRRRAEQRMLQAQWDRQVGIASKQRLLAECKNGKILTLSTTLSTTLSQPAI